MRKARQKPGHGAGRQGARLLVALGELIEDQRGLIERACRLEGELRAERVRAMGNARQRRYRERQRGDCPCPECGR